MEIVATRPINDRVPKKYQKLYKTLKWVDSSTSVKVRTHTMRFCIRGGQKD